MNDIKLNDVIGITNISDYSHNNKVFIYAVGTKIVIQNLISGRKTFIDYHTSDIDVIKIITVNNSKTIFISIDKSISSPVLCLWETYLGHTQCIQQHMIPTRNNFKTYKVFVSPKAKSNSLFVLITSIDCNLLYSFNIDDNNVTFLTDIPSEERIINFSSFLSSKNIVISTYNTISWYRIDTRCEMINNIRFPFRIKEMMTTGNITSNISFITENGNVLVYDKEGNKIDVVTLCSGIALLSTFGTRGYSLLISNEQGKIFSYTNSETMKYYLDVNKKIGHKVQIEKFFIDEEIDSILIVMKGVILLSSIASMLENHRTKLLFTSVGNIDEYIDTFQTGRINSITPLQSPYMFASCSSEGSINYIKKTLDNRLSSQIINYNDINDGITVIQLKGDKIYCGTQQGRLCVFHYTKGNIPFGLREIYRIGTYAISSIDVSDIFIAIGFVTGMIVLCDLRKQCEYCVRLSESYRDVLKVDNVNEISSYVYFFKLKQYSRKGISILYMKSSTMIELSSITSSNLLTSSNVVSTLKLNHYIIDMTVHPSENYIIALTSLSSILIASIITGEVTAMIALPPSISSSNKFTIDQTGLYIALLCSKSNTLVFIEIGTGKAIAKLKINKESSSLSFDNSGDYLSIGDNEGIMTIIESTDAMRRAMSNVRREVMRNVMFWEQYEIRYNVRNDDIAFNNQYVQADLPDNEKVVLKRKIEMNTGDESDAFYVNKVNKVRNVFEDNLKNSVNNEGMSLQECYRRREKSKNRKKLINRERKFEKDKEKTIEKSPAEEEIDLYDLKSDINKSNGNTIKTKKIESTNKSIKMIPRSIDNYKDELPPQYDIKNITINQDPNIYSKQSIKNKPKNVIPNGASYSNLNQKIISSSSTQQQNDIRIKNIANAINEMILSKPNKVIEESTPQLPSFNINYIPTKESIHNNDYFINNTIDKSLPKKYPEPIDIDEDVIDSHTNNRINTKSTNDNNSFSIMRTNNGNPYQRTSFTDQIDYLDDKINNFEHNLIK